VVDVLLVVREVLELGVGGLGAAVLAARAAAGDGVEPLEQVPLASELRS